MDNKKIVSLFKKFLKDKDSYVRYCENIDGDFDSFVGSQLESIPAYMLIELSFSWNSTPEKGDYWGTINDAWINLADKKKL